MRELIQLRDRKSHHCAARRQTLQLAAASERQPRQPRVLFLLCCGHETLEQRPHRARAHEPGFEPAASVQQTLGEHMPAFVVRRELDLIDRDEVGLHAGRHGLGRAHPILRVPRDALFLARDQRHTVSSDASSDAIVNLARQ